MLRALGVVGGVGLAAAGIWGALAFAKSGHPILAFLCGAGAVGAGGNIAYTGLVGESPWAQAAAAAAGRTPTVTQNVGASSVA